MLDVLRERLRQKYRTHAFPAAEPALSDRFRGLPRIAPGHCGPSCAICVELCPVGAIRREDANPTIDLGRCIFCDTCVKACPTGCIGFTGDYRLAARNRADLLVRDNTLRLAEALSERALRLFGRSLRLREVSAGGCNACEADTNVLTTLAFDLGRFGIDFVASPRHADGLYVTGPVTANMREALLKTWDATPAPKLVIAAGACAIEGGPFRGLPDAGTGVDPHLPVDLYIPGCPPHPYTALDGLLRLLNRR